MYDSENSSPGTIEKIGRLLLLLAVDSRMGSISDDDDNDDDDDDNDDDDDDDDDDSFLLIPDVIDLVSSPKKEQIDY